MDISLVSLFLLSFSYGLSSCMLSCMPLLSPIILANSKDGLKIVTIFSIGRVASYMLLSIFAFIAGIFILSLLQNQQLLSIISGLITMILATLLWFDKKSCVVDMKKSIGFFGYFGLGFSMGLNPCLPLLTLISISAKSDTLINSIMNALVFGFGAVIVSFLFYGFFLSEVAKKILTELNSYKIIIQKSSIILLFIVGFLITFGFIKV
ncbi:MAG: sulfite exporter TauE/SafE family protein [Campylobacterales bacterium]|nr:sulfite exporter TauE/SafE family protein [Campylobacterales bacterium]